MAKKQAQAASSKATKSKGTAATKAAAKKKPAAKKAPAKKPQAKKATAPKAEKKAPLHPELKKKMYWRNPTYIPGLHPGTLEEFGTVRGEVTPEALSAFKAAIPAGVKMEDWISDRDIAAEQKAIAVAKGKKRLGVPLTKEEEKLVGVS